MWVDFITLMDCILVFYSFSSNVIGSTHTQVQVQVQTLVLSKESVLRHTVTSLGSYSLVQWVTMWVDFSISTVAFNWKTAVFLGILVSSRSFRHFTYSTIDLQIVSHNVKGKGKRKCIAVNGIPSHSYGVSLAIWDHTVLPATWHKWTHPALTSAIQAGTRFTYPGGMEGWVDLGDLLHTEMVYPPTDGHPSKY